MEILVNANVLKLVNIDVEILVNVDVELLVDVEILVNLEQLNLNPLSKTIQI